MRYFYHGHVGHDAPDEIDLAEARRRLNEGLKAEGSPTMPDDVAQRALNNSPVDNPMDVGEGFLWSERNESAGYGRFEAGRFEPEKRGSTEADG